MPKRNRLVSLLAATVLFGALGSFGLTTTAGAEPERAADGAVVVRASGTTEDGIGAGTIIAVGPTTVTVLTAKHVATYGALTIRFADDTKVPAHIVSLIHDRDLALISADVDTSYAATLHAAPIGRAARNLPVHVWGSGISGPAFEPGSVNTVGAALPDGTVHERYTLACNLCHQGDSGAGVFDSRGYLVGVYVGFFEMENGRLSVAEQPLDAAALASAGVSTATVARSNAAAATPGENAGVVAATFASKR
jgi:hypothetical protein